tara:strand:+ start:2234 stop:2785 length:552 start_codon:yes stop_codon:yes gene_type:complete
MKYFKIIILIILFLFNHKSYAGENIVEILKKNNNIILIRHSLAPGTGDPENINLNDCKTQRNLNIEGIRQSKKIGNFFKKNNIKVEKVFSSEWCRCKDTAFYAFSNFEIFDALNSFYSEKFYENKNKQIKNLKEFINNWDNKSNLVLVTHYVVILELFGVGAGSGEIIISNKNYEIVDRIEIN